MDGPKQLPEDREADKLPTLAELVSAKMTHDKTVKPQVGVRPSTVAVFCIGIMLTLATGWMISSLFHIESGPEERFEVIALVILVFILFHPRSRKVALIIVTVLFCLVFIGGTSTLISHRESTRNFPTYQAGKFADDADEPAIDFHEQLAQRPDSVRFLVEHVPEGTWSRVYILPDKLRQGMCVEPYPAEDMKSKDLYMAFDFLRLDRSSYYSI